MKQKCNKDIGNTFELDFCNLMFSNGFWSHNFVSSHSGQPADTISSKNGKSILADCKVCKSNKFSLSRIEDNQLSSMTLWQSCGNGEGWFALQLTDKSIYMFTLNTLLTYPTRLKNSFEESEIRKVGIPFDKWIKEINNEFSN